jgi:hypothetical protein
VSAPGRGRRGGPGLSRIAGALQGQGGGLVAPPRPPPPFQPRGQVVGIPRALPGLIDYGHQPPGFVQSSRFTGGTVPNPMSIAHGEQTPGFTAPSFGPTGAVAPSGLVAALARLMGAAPAPTGATASDQGGGFRPQSPVLPPPPPPGMYWNPSTTFGTPWDPTVPQQGVNSPPSGEQPQRGGTAALIAALAQIGQRLGSSRSAPAFY